MWAMGDWRQSCFTTQGSSSGHKQVWDSRPVCLVIHADKVVYKKKQHQQFGMYLNVSNKSHDALIHSWRHGQGNRLFLFLLSSDGSNGT